MPKPPLPPDLVAFLAEPNPSVIATIRRDGSPHTAATWYLWVDGRVLVNMGEGRGRSYPQRDRGRVSAWIEVTSWHAWAVIEPWTGGH
jgi:hypothetical protein